MVPVLEEGREIPEVEGLETTGASVAWTAVATTATKAGLSENSEVGGETGMATFAATQDGRRKRAWQNTSSTRGFQEAGRQGVVGLASTARVTIHVA